MRFTPIVITTGIREFVSRDWAAVRALWTLHRHTLDTDRIHHVLSLLEEALDQSELVATFDRMREGH